MDDLTRKQAWLLVSLCAITCSVVVRASANAASSEAVVNPSDLVFTTEDRASGDPGCDSISAFDLRALLDTPASPALHRGPTHISPGRMAAMSDLSLVMATPTNVERFLTIIRMDPTSPPYSKWFDERIIDDRIAFFGGIAILPGNREFLVATSGKLYGVAGGNATRNISPYKVRKFAIPARGSAALEREHGALSIERVGVEIVLAGPSHNAHILTDGAKIHTIDVDTMEEVGAPISVAGVRGISSPIHGTAPQAVRAAITVDRRYLISNRGIMPEVDVADLISRTAWTLPTSPAKMTGGLAINQGEINHGLLAIHHRDRVTVYRLFPTSALVELGSVKIPPPQTPPSSDKPDGFGPYLSIAWGGNGAYLIAASDDRGSEFVVIEVKDDGTNLAIKRFLTACAPDLNLPNDILTSNNPNVPPPITPTPTDTPTPTITPTPTDTPTPTHTPSPTRTLAPSATPTSSPTPTTIPSTTPSPTPSPTSRPLTPIYLPVILTESCTPGQRRADVLLVIDTSSSMLELTTAGRPKIDAAREAAGSFIDLLQLPSDQAGIAWFNETAGLAQPLTGDRPALRTALQSLTVHQFTRIDLGVQIAHAELLSPRHRAGNAPVLILLTDGRSNPVPASFAVDAAARAKADGVTVFTIGVGLDLDEAALAEMASPCWSGADCPYYFKAPDAEELGAIYRRIAGVIPCGAEAFWGRR